jgi:hypothetical protein
VIRRGRRPSPARTRCSNCAGSRVSRSRGFRAIQCRAILSKRGRAQWSARDLREYPESGSCPCIRARPLDQVAGHTRRCSADTPSQPVLRRACAALTVALGPILMVDGACTSAQQERAAAPPRPIHDSSRDAATWIVPAPGMPQVLPPQQGLPPVVASGAEVDRAAGLRRFPPAWPRRLPLPQASPSFRSKAHCGDPFCVSVDKPPEARAELLRRERQSETGGAKGTRAGRKAG